MPDRVLLTADTVGGVWNFALELATGLCGRGVEVMLASLGGEPREDQRAEAESIRRLQLRTSGYKLEWMEDPWRDVEDSGNWLLDLAKEFRPDVVHLNSFGHGTLRWRIPTVMTAHSCVLSWWAAVRGDALPSAWTRYRHEVEYSLKSVDMVTAPTHAMMRALEENYGVDLPPRRVLPNGRRRGRYCALRKEPFLLTAGRLWDEAKNVDAVARAAGSLQWPVYVAGECRQELEGCRTLGRLSSDALASWYGRASIYVLPARYEPFGLSALEAALSGCALVLGDIESLREVWGDAALYALPNDHAALVEALRTLMEDAEVRQEFARKSLARAREYSAERMVSGYLDAYGAVAGVRRMSCGS